MKMSMNIKKLNIVFCSFFAILFLVLLSSINVKAATQVQAIIPIELSAFDSEGKELKADEEDLFTLRLTAYDKNTPMPFGSEGNIYTESILPGTKELVVTFAEPGDYRYKVTADEKEGFTPAPSYEVLVRIHPDGYVQAAAFNEEGNKCEISFEMVREKGQPDAPSSDDKIKEFVDVTEASDETKSGEEGDNNLESKNPGNREPELLNKNGAASKISEAGLVASEKNSLSHGGRQTNIAQKENIQKGNTAPSTGDEATLIYYIFALAAGLVLAVSIIFFRIKHGKKL